MEQTTQEVYPGEDEPPSLEAAGGESSAASPDQPHPHDIAAFRTIWHLAWPVTITMGVHTAFELIDLYWISALGTEAIAGVSLVGNILFSTFILTQIVYVGAIAMITRRIGEGRISGPDSAEDVAAQVLPLSVLIGSVTAVLGMLLAGPGVRLFGATPEVTKHGVAYLVPMMATYFSVCPYVAFSAIFTAARDTRTPMYVGVASNVINAVLDPFFIFGWAGFPALGIAGAAVATIISGVFGVIVMAVVYRRRTLPFPTAPFFEWHGTTSWRTVMRIGIPGSIGMLTRPLSTVFLLGVMARLGAAGVAAFGITIRALSILWLMHAAMGTAVSTLAGQALGAHDLPGIHRLVRRALGLGLIGATVLGAGYFIWPRVVIGFFEKSNQEVLDLGAVFMRLLVLSNIGTSLSVVWGSVLRGAGDTRPPMVIALLANWVVKLPLAYILAVTLEIGVPGVWWAMFISLVFESMAIFVWYRRGKWVHAEV